MASEKPITENVEPLDTIDTRKVSLVTRFFSGRFH